MRQIKLIIKNLYDNVYLASFGRNFIKIAFWSDSDDWFDASYKSSTSDPTDDLNLMYT